MLQLYLGYLLDLIFGDPYSMPHPVRYIGKAISWTEKSLRKIFKTEEALKIGGFLLTFIIVGGTFAFYFFVLYFAGKISTTLAFCLEAFMIYQIFATRCLGDEGRKIYKVLMNGDIEKSRTLISYLVSRDTSAMSEEDIIKATVETITENIIDGIIAPMIFVVIGGAPLGMAYKAANTLDSMVGYKNDKYMNFGYASAKFDDILNYIPARISGLLVVISAFVLGMDYKNSFRILLRDKNNHSSPNSAYSEAASAGALKIQLGGKATYFGVTQMKPTMGDYIEKPAPIHIMKSIRLMHAASFIGLVIFSTRYLI